MRKTTLAFDKDVRPFDSDRVDMSSRRIKPTQLAVTSKYVLDGQVRFLVEQLFPKLIRKGINPFNIHGSVHVAVHSDDQPSYEVDFGSPVCEVLEQQAADGVTK